ncbi:hypothetical protein NUU61_004980 [Penicillium alfredii]|uniref:Uncharacterized protein n=1 Tax=Penicillium alfredii TaxID=1506179 RepID=A0A9W9K764_9EURO|nr:uncharacterized protein NUU61_004980 [Penicillium alfredii]KAJ5095624.1 hypothetical protein NUU61_004980 [Penicillium alfredii]
MDLGATNAVGFSAQLEFINWFPPLPRTSHLQPLSETPLGVKIYPESPQQHTKSTYPDFSPGTIHYGLQQ